MPRFIIEERFWELFPDARIGVALCTGIDNASRDEPAYEALLREGERKAALSELAGLVRERLGGSCSQHVLSRDEPELRLG